MPSFPTRPRHSATQITSYQRQARKKLLKAHRKGERGLANLAERTGKSERQTSRYLNDYGLSAAADPVDAALSSVEPLDDDVAERLLNDLQAMGDDISRWGIQQWHATCEHLLGNIEAALGRPLSAPALDKPVLVFNPATVEGVPLVDATGEEVGGLGASRIGAAVNEKTGQALDVMMVHERVDGIDFFPDASSELTAYHFIIPETPKVGTVTRVDDPGWRNSNGLVLAPSLQDAIEAVMGVWSTPGKDGQWQLEAWRFAEQAHRMQSDVNASGRFSRVQEHWFADDKGFFWYLTPEYEGEGESDLVYTSMEAGLMCVREKDVDSLFLQMAARYPATNGAGT